MERLQRLLFFCSQRRRWFAEISNTWITIPMGNINFFVPVNLIFTYIIFPVNNDVNKLTKKIIKNLVLNIKDAFRKRNRKTLI
uniref:Uncharacterized protein n=1 Tax=Moorella thermoacetica (strain ATCC 39073 / JCM 9320) TaxID=264732 RepID=Q2RIH8_MOOTA